MDEIKKKMPLGLIIIILFMLWGIKSLLVGLQMPFTQLGPFILMGVGAIIVNLVIIALLCVIIFGIIKRFVWARKLAIGWNVFSMVFLLINLLSFMANNTMYNDYYSQILPPEQAAVMTPPMITMGLVFGLVFGLIYGGIVIVYLLKNKDFFTN